MTRINVPLPGEALSALADLSAREWRDPRDQAAVIILEALRQRGLITEDQPTNAIEHPAAAPAGPGEAA